MDTAGFQYKLEQGLLQLQDLTTQQVNFNEWYYNLLYILAARSSDFKAGNYYFNCPSYTNEAIVKIPIFDNNKKEGKESFAVSLFISRHYQDKGVKIVSPYTAEVIIEDGKCYCAMRFYYWICPAYLQMMSHQQLLLLLQHQPQGSQLPLLQWNQLKHLEVFLLTRYQFLFMKCL